MTFGPQSRRLFSERPGSVRMPFALRYRSATSDEASDPLARSAALARVEAVLMMADEPLTSRRLAEIAGLDDGHHARRLVEELKTRYEADGTAFEVAELAGGFQLLTRSECHSWLLRLRRTGYDLRLSGASLETLAVIAYKQPIMRAEVEKIRGVMCSDLIRMLMEKGLVRVTGRHDSLGRPQLFGTTKKFLQHFGLKSVEDLPEVASLAAPGAKK